MYANPRHSLSMIYYPFWQTCDGMCTCLISLWSIWWGTVLTYLPNNALCVVRNLEQEWQRLSAIV